jgi:hypothetical protein
MRGKLIHRGRYGLQNPRPAEQNNDLRFRKPLASRSTRSMSTRCRGPRNAPRGHDSVQSSGVSASGAMPPSAISTSAVVVCRRAIRL